MRMTISEFNIASSKQYKGMPEEYFAISIKEGEQIYNGLMKYFNNYGKDAIGSVLIINDLDGVPNHIKKKYENVTFRITANLISKFKPEGDDDSWARHKFLRNPIKGMFHSYKNSVKDLIRKPTASKLAVDKDWNDYKPAIHVSTNSKSGFIQEWVRFKQRYFEQTYYFADKISPSTYNLLTRNKFVMLLRGLSILVHPLISVPLNVVLGLGGAVFSYYFFNDPMEVEAFAAFFIASKKDQGQFDRKYFSTLFKDDHEVHTIIPKSVFIAKYLSPFNIRYLYLNSQNKDRFETLIYHEFLKVEGI